MNSLLDDGGEKVRNLLVISVVVDVVFGSEVLMGVSPVKADATVISVVVAGSSVESIVDEGRN